MDRYDWEDHGKTKENNFTQVLARWRLHCECGDKAAKAGKKHTVRITGRRPLMTDEALSADSDDLARVYRFDLAQDSEMISPTIPILMSPGA